jgi:tRNA(Ile)-lysidine synthase
MLAALSALRGEMDFVLRCFHLEHGIRPPEESRGDARAVRELCAGFGIPCRIVSIRPGRIAAFARRRGTGIEGAARLFRRRAWNREARRTGAERILVAHTQDDLVETLLMRFLRGAGPEGLAAMPRERGRILRPLLGLTRAAVLSYLKKREISYRIDATNGDDRYLRNRIRNRLIPFLDEYFPHWKKPALFLAETQRLTADFLADEAAQRVKWQGREGNFTTGAEAFFSQPEIIREEALFRILNRGKPRGPSSGFLDREKPLLPDAPIKGASVPRRSSLRLFTRGKSPGMDLGPLRVMRKGERLTLSFRESPSPEGGFALLIKEPGIYRLKGLSVAVVSLQKGGELPQKKWDTKPVSGFFASLPLVLRRSFHDDFIIRAGRKRHPFPLLEGEGASGYTDIITAADAGGPAAFISREGAVLLRREEGAAEFFFIVSGGINVQ